MKRIILLMAAVAAGGGLTWGEYISPAEALQRVGNLPGKNMPARLKAVSKADIKPAYTISDPEGTPALYIFNDANAGGLILSAESEVTPLLGYSDSGSFDVNNMPPAMSWWLEMLTEEISEVRKVAGATLGALTLPEEWEAIKPLCTTKWSQGDPYNRMTPVYNNKNCMTGCVATGMAQAIKYFNYPEHGTGKIKYNVSHIGDLEMNFEEAEFDWANMTDTYGGSSTTKEKDAVALLMKACGYASRMWYNTNSSGTQSSYIDGGLRDYFAMHKDTKFEERKNYYGVDWAMMIYNNIKNCGPVIYSGYSNIGEGHCFVCDGYDGNGLFHFNWGWGGLSDGYFALNNLNPSEQGIGSSIGGYRYMQNAVIGMRPKDMELTASMMTALSQTGQITYKVSGTNLNGAVGNKTTGGWTNVTPVAVKCAIGAIFEPQNGTPGETKYVTYVNTELEPGAKYKVASLENEKIIIDLTALNLENGQYLVSTAYCLEGEDKWHPVFTNYKNFSGTLLTKTDEGYTSKSVHNNTAKFDLVDVDEAYYYDMNVNMHLVLSNNGYTAVTHGLAPCLLSGDDIVARGQGMMVDLLPGETCERKWISKFVFNDANHTKTAARTYRFAIYDPNTWEILWRAPKTTKISPAEFPTVKIGKFNMPGTAKRGGYTTVTDASNVVFHTEVIFSKGELPEPLCLTVWGNDPETGEYGLLLKHYIDDYKELAADGQKITAEFKVPLYGVNSEDVYTAYCSYYGFNQWNHLPNRSTGIVTAVEFKFDASGVEELAAQAPLKVTCTDGLLSAQYGAGISSIEVYDVNGMLLGSQACHGESEANLSVNAAHGLLIVKITDAEGNLNSCKVLCK